jgi:3-oxoacyl-[acyl-carrier-protein] synthase II
MRLSIDHWELLTPLGDKEALSSYPTGPAFGCRSIEHFDKERLLGRVGTRNFDRQTSLFVHASSRVLAEAQIDSEQRERLGIVLGTAAGSVSSTLDFLEDSLRCDKPYDVNPGHFPNTVINCASGQAAIWNRLRGPNATISAGAQSFFVSLKFATRWCASRKTDGVVVGAVEEVTPRISALHAAYHASAPISVLEACGAFLLMTSPRRSNAVLATEVLATEVLARSPRASDVSSTLVQCIGRCVQSAGAAIEDVAYAVTRRETHEWSALDAIQFRGERVAAAARFGDAYSASGAVQLAIALRLVPRSAGPLVLLTSASSNGSVASAVVRLQRPAREAA